MRSLGSALDGAAGLKNMPLAYSLEVNIPELYFTGRPPNKKLQNTGADADADADADDHMLMQYTWLWAPLLFLVFYAGKGGFAASRALRSGGRQSQKTKRNKIQRRKQWKYYTKAARHRESQSA